MPQIDNVAFNPLFTWEQSSDCGTYYFEDTTCSCPSGYSVSNIEKADVTATKIVVSDNNGNEWTYSDYLPTQGEVELTFESFSQTVTAEATVTDTGCGCTTETTEAANFHDGCYTIVYYVYSGVDGTTLEGSVSTSLYFYCIVRNRIYDLILGQCSDCCDQEKQYQIWEVRSMYEDMLTTYNKVGCGCAEGILAQIEKRLDKIEGNC